MRQTVKYVVLLLFALASISLHAQEPALTATVSKNKLGQNQRLRIVFAVNKQGADNFQRPNFKNFRVVSGPINSISQSWINGKASFSQSYTFILEPLRKGEFMIPSASIELAGKTLKSKPVKVIVLNPVEIPKDPNDPHYIAQQNVHLVAEISKAKPYVGEGVYVEYKLYVSRNISVNDYSVTEAPQYNGFWNQDIRINGLTPRDGKYNGEQYRYVVLKKALLIPTRSGKLTIDPMIMDIVVGVPTGRGDFFGNPIVRTITKNFSSAKKTVNVQDLPLDGKPLTFNGAVGQFDFDVTASRNILKSNESARISVGVTGKGNLTLFELPEIKTPAELEVFTPEKKEKIKITPSGIKGSVTTEYTVVPEYKGKYKVPSTEFSYFDPKKKEYVTLNSEDLFVEVLEGKEIVTDSENSVIKKAVTSKGTSFRYIATKSSFVEASTSDFFKSNAYYLLLFLPMIFIPIGIVIAKRNEARNADVIGNKLRKADRLAKKYLSEAKKQLGKKEAFYVALEKALHNYLKAKLRIETSDISKEKIRELLADKKVDNGSIESFIDVFKSCDMARYSPMTVADMNNDYENAKQVITQIDKQL
jgi:hypothetical protein